LPEPIRSRWTPTPPKPYWDLDWHTLRYLKLASERGLGTLSFETARSRFVTL
jgi:hypothetical protein